VEKLIKVPNCWSIDLEDEKPDCWSLISLRNDFGRNLEFKFVYNMKRQFVYSLDSFQILLTPYLLQWCAFDARSKHFWKIPIGSPNKVRRHLLTNRSSQTNCGKSRQLHDSSDIRTPQVKCHLQNSKTSMHTSDSHRMECSHRSIAATSSKLLLPPRKVPLQIPTSRSKHLDGFCQGPSCTSSSIQPSPSPPSPQLQPTSVTPSRATNFSLPIIQTPLQSFRKTPSTLSDVADFEKSHTSAVPLPSPNSSRKSADISSWNTTKSDVSARNCGGKRYLHPAENLTEEAIRTLSTNILCEERAYLYPSSSHSSNVNVHDRNYSDSSMRTTNTSSREGS